MDKQLRNFFRLLLSLVLITGTVKLQAQQNGLGKQDCFQAKAGDLRSITIGQSITESQSLHLFSGGEAISALTLNADIQFMNKASLVRVILVDDQSNEHLVYETYPAIANSKSVSVTNICEETALLNGVVPVSLQVQLINARISIKDIGISTAAARYSGEEFYAVKQATLNAQNDAKIEAINQNNKINGLNWVAGKTDVSHLPYEQKKHLVNGPDLNLQGFEYYKGGVFVYDLGYEDNSQGKLNSPTALVDRWDWRERHGANRAGSPYYDGDAKKGGWMTTIQNQKCNQCWSFAPTATIEALTNLYFNQHLNIDLSEQNGAACGGGASGECEGGNSSSTINYIAKTGIVNEACMPYANTDKIACSATCASPVDRIKAASTFSVSIKDVAEMKKTIIKYGPISSGVHGMWHFMALIGYYTDANGGNVWIMKNSWGINSGENGFANIQITGSGEKDYLYGNGAFRTPLTSLKTYAVACNDKDGDGYYNWGIGTKPTTCATCPNEADGDDSDPCSGPLNLDFYTTSLKSAITTQLLSTQTAKIGSTVTFGIIASGGISMKYQWKKDGIDIPGALAATLTLSNVSAKDNGAYKCVVTTPCNTVTSNEGNLVVANTNGIAELTENAADLSVFPNPSNGFITIGYQLSSKAVAKLSIVNLLGAEARVLVNNQELEKGAHTVNVSTLEPGVYFCILTFANRSITKKIVILE